MLFPALRRGGAATATAAGLTGITGMEFPAYQGLVAALTRLGGPSTAFIAEALVSMNDQS